MISTTLPAKAQEILLEDAARRDRKTARRMVLLGILLHEHFFTREQLVARVEMILGKNCFGKTTWEGTFHRDMRVVKQSLQAAGYRLVYRRSKQATGYSIQGQPVLSPEISAALAGSIAEVDPAQLRVTRRLSPADRFRQGCSISDTARNAVAYRIRRKNPGLSLEEANRMALHHQTL